ncbi:MAG TPA: sigma-54 dependent transcriptional regulator [Myxococcales bacterium]|nr:sigma-54 dependent transcriptional regulator [Myxococcales bacterium]
MSRRILLVDDDPAVLRGVSGLLRDEGYSTETATTAAEAHESISRDPPAAVILDVQLPGESGLSLLARLPRPLPAPVVVLSGGATPGEAAQALKLGATDFVEKPPTAERVLTALQNALALRDLEDERQRLREELAQPGNLVGESPAMAELRKLVARAGPSDSVVLVQGETGTGKERVARALHLASGRKGRFVAVNCAAIPAQLLESELFGAEKGAFTGATARRLGRFEQAEGGTLLLDELGELPLELQAKLLRVLEQREVERLGGTAPVRVDVRVVAATHRDLRKAVSDGGFREDLYYRLAVFPIQVPPLRQRPDDVIPLARAFAAELRGPLVELRMTPQGEKALRAHAWPGNVRELRNFVERLHLLSDPGPLVVDQDAALLLGPAETTSKGVDGLGTLSYRELCEEAEREILRQALAQSDGNVAAAARLLKVDRGNLYRRIKALGVDVEE